MYLCGILARKSTYAEGNGHKNNERSLFILLLNQKESKMRTYPGSFPKETTESVIRDYRGKYKYKEI
jgi:hypothetical protein